MNIKEILKLIESIQIDCFPSTSSHFSIKTKNAKEKCAVIQKPREQVKEMLLDNKSDEYDVNEYSQHGYSITIQIMKSCEEAAAHTIAISTSTVKSENLSKVSLPRLDGYRLICKLFCEIFYELMQERLISSWKKMRYFKANLMEEAERLICHFSPYRG